MTDENKNCLLYKTNIPKTINEFKLKTLEARMIGPSKEGLLPISSHIDDFENIKSRLSINSEQNSVLDQNVNDLSNISNANNNINKQISQVSSQVFHSKRKNQNPEKAVMYSKIVNNQSISFLSTKRQSKILNNNVSQPGNISSNRLEKNSNYSRNTDSESENSNFSYEKKNRLKEEEMISSKYLSNDYFKKKTSATQNTSKKLSNANSINLNIVNQNTNISINSSNNQGNTLNNNTKINNYFKNQQGNINFNMNSNINMTMNNINNNTNSISNLNSQLNQANQVNNEKTFLQISIEEYDELNKLKLEMEFMKKTILEKEIEIEQLKFKINESEQNYKNVINEMETIQDAKERTTESLVIVLRELEEMKRNKQKEWVNNQSFKIGKIKYYSQGNRMGQIWEDGVEVKFTKQDLEKIIKEKEEEKKAKRKIPSTNFDKLEEAKFKMEKLNRSEADVKEKLVKYYKERIVLEAEDRRLTEENKSTYMKNNWPILNKRYLILSLIGKGGYSEVYKAYDLVNHINVACKIHQLEQSWSETVKELYIRHTIRENQIHQKINHEKIVKHFDTVEIDNNSFATVLELCSGPDLSYYLKQNGHLGEREARIIIKQIIIGLKELHRQGIIHYDLKPQNIIFHKGEIKISDFGLAKEMADKDKIELTTMGVGTYYYLPPETFSSQNKNNLIDQKVDIWSVGIIFYELLYGVKPFANNISQEDILKNNLIILSKSVEFPTDSKLSVSKETQDFIRRCLSKDVNLRYNVYQAYDALNELGRLNK